MEIGQRFSQQYLDRGAPVRDSMRFRNRLDAYFKDKFAFTHWQNIATLITSETGALVPGGSSNPGMTRFFQEGQMRDVLDSVTIICKYLQSRGMRPMESEWRMFVDRAFREESLGYKVDARGGVHYYIDEEFERGRVATVAGLTEAKYAGVAAAVSDAFRHMDTADTKAAVRSIFEALEILAKQMVQTNNLNKTLVEKILKDACLKQYPGDATGRKVEEAMFSSFAQWVDGIHNYRHGQGSADPVAPSDELAVHILSTGCAYVRWLVGHHKTFPVA